MSWGVSMLLDSLEDWYAEVVLLVCAFLGVLGLVGFRERGVMSGGTR